MTTYKDSKVVNFEHNKTFENDEVRESTITLNSHTGTHIDSPAHFLKDGKTVEQISLDSLVGPCRVLDFSEVQEKITMSDLEQHDIREDDILLLKTKNSALDPQEKFNHGFVDRKSVL